MFENAIGNFSKCPACCRMIGSNEATVCVDGEPYHTSCAGVVEQSCDQPSQKVAPTPADLVTTLTERGSRYGKFTSHARITQRLKHIITDELAMRDRILDDDQQEALDMICHKIGRIVNGDPNYADSWVDIAGYAKLVADRLEGVER